MKNSEGLRTMNLKTRTYYGTNTFRTSNCLLRFLFDRLPFGMYLANMTRLHFQSFFTYVVSYTSKNLQSEDLRIFTYPLLKHIPNFCVLNLNLIQNYG